MLHHSLVLTLLFTMFVVFLPWKQGECVVLNPPKGAPLPAFSGDNILVPQSSAEAEYFCR
jgi:hypothetical protein